MCPILCHGKVGVDGVRGKLDYVAAVELYLLLAVHTPPPSSPPSPSPSDDAPVASILADVRELAQCLSSSEPLFKPLYEPLFQPFSEPLFKPLSGPLSQPFSEPLSGVRGRLARLHRSIARAIFLAQPLVLTLSCDRLVVDS